jgi:hypothetical protein
MLGSLAWDAHAPALAPSRTDLLPSSSRARWPWTSVARVPLAPPPLAILRECRWKSGGHGIQVCCRRQPECVGQPGWGSWVLVGVDSVWACHLWREGACGGFGLCVEKKKEFSNGLSVKSRCGVDIHYRVDPIAGKWCIAIPLGSRLFCYIEYRYLLIPAPKCCSLCTFGIVGNIASFLVA